MLRLSWSAFVHHRVERSRWPLFRVLIVATILASFVTVLPAQQPALAGQAQYSLSGVTNLAQSTQVNTTFGENLIVRVRHTAAPNDPPVNGVEIQYKVTPASNGASGTFANGSDTVLVTSTSWNGQPGYAFAPAFTANGIPGTYTINATVPSDGIYTLLIPFTMTNTEDNSTKAHSISAGDGSLQATLLNTTYPTPFYAIVRNGNNQLKSGVTVTFTAPASGPSGVFASTNTNVATAVTNGNGVATAPSFTANGTQGGYSVTATVSGDQTTTGEELATAYGLRNSSTNVLGVPETVSSSAGNFQVVGVSSPVPTNLRVVVLDGSLDFVVGATVTFTLPATGASGTFSNGTRVSTATTNSQGLASALPITTNTIVGQIAVEVVATKDGISASTNMSISNGKVLTTTTLSINPGSSVYGQPVAVRATVTAQEGSLVPSGPVDFKRDNVLIPGCTGVTPVNGVATCNQTWLEPGTYAYSAEYRGDTVSFSSSSQTLNHTVTKASTSITLTSSHPDFALEGENVTITATVNPVPPGAAQPGEPTGGVTFTASDGTLLNGGNPVALVNGVASVSTSALSVGDITITASYGGDAHFLSSSNTILQYIYTVPEVTTDPQNALVLVGNQATFTAAADGYPVPTVQWQVSTDGGDNFEDLLNATTTTLTFSPTVADDGKLYRAVFTNPAGSDTSLAALLTVRQPPAITSADATTFEVGVEGTFSVTAEGYLAPDLSLEGTLPTGVTFDPDTGLLAGTAADESGGVYPLVFTAANGTAPDAVQNFTLTVNEAPEITSVDSATFDVGVVENFDVTASGYPAATFSTDGTLPLGISLNPDGSLGGTAQEGGVFTFDITASNGLAPDAVQTFTLTVNKADQESLTVTGPASGEFGQILDLTAAGGSGTGQLSFTVLPESTACALITSGPDTGKLEITDSTGLCRITATKASDSYYNSLTSAAFNVTVSRATTSLVAGNVTGTFDGTVELSATLMAHGNPVEGRTIVFTVNGIQAGTAQTDASGVATLSGASLSGIDAGTYPTGVGASFAGDALYADATDTAALDVNKAPGSVSISNLPVIAKVDRTLTLAYTVLGDGTPSAESLTQAICTVSGDVVSFVSPGICELQASIAEGTNHLAATGAVQSLEVVPNFPPVITDFTGPSGSVAHGVAIDVLGTFTDGNAMDVHTATIDWGDGQTTAGVVTEANGAGTVAGNHSYLSPGMYVITLTVTDDDNASDSRELASSVIIYEPLCVSLYTGSVSSPIGNSCGSGQVQLNPVEQTFCIDNYTGKITYSGARPCPAGKRAHVLPRDGDLLMCVNAYTGASRWVWNHSLCTRYEMRETIRAFS